MKKFNWKRAAFVFLLCEVVVLMAGCNVPAWITTAQSILPIAGQMAAGVLSILAGFGILPGAAGVLATVIQDASAGFADVQKMIKEYQANPSTTLLGNIENALKAITDNITPFLTDTGLGSLSAKADSVVKGILQLMISEVTSIASIMPLLKASAGTKLSVTIPYDAKAFAAKYNSILDTLTGDAKVDGILAKLPRLS